MNGIESRARRLSRLKSSDTNDHTGMIRLDEPCEALGGAVWVPAWLSAPIFRFDHDDSTETPKYSSLELRALSIAIKFLTEHEKEISPENVSQKCRDFGSPRMTPMEANP